MNRILTGFQRHWLSRIGLALASGVLLAGCFGQESSSVAPPKDLRWEAAEFLGLDITAVLWADSQLVAVGHGPDVLVSPEGVEWSAFAMERPANLRALAWTGEAYVAVGDSGAVRTSRDGKAWVGHDGNRSMNLNSVLWTGKDLLALGVSFGSRFLLASENLGQSWDTIQAGPDFEPLAMLKAGGRFLLVSRDVADRHDSTSTMESLDGRNWRLIRRDHAQISNLAWSGSTLAGFGSEETATFGRASGLFIFSDTLGWTSTLSTPYRTYADVVHGLSWSGREFIAPSNSVGGLANISYGALVSQDGVAWTKINAPLQFAVWTGKQSVGFSLFRSGVGQGYLFPTHYLSTDGVHWSAKYAKPGFINGFDGDGDEFFAVGVSGGIFASKEGKAWKTVNSGVDVHLKDLAWSGKTWVVVGARGTILNSPDGHHWTPVNSGSGMSLQVVDWSGGRFTAYGDSGIILTSPDGGSWTLETSGTQESFRHVAGSATFQVAIDSRGRLLASTGEGWHPAPVDSSLHFNSLVWSGSSVTAYGSTLDGTGRRSWMYAALTGNGKVWAYRLFSIPTPQGWSIRSFDNVRLCGDRTVGLVKVLVDSSPGLVLSARVVSRKGLDWDFEGILPDELNRLDCVGSLEFGQTAFGDLFVSPKAP